MAIYETLSGRITDTNVAWQDKSGQHVEDFICQSISDLGDKDISSLAYDATSHELSLFNKKGQVVAHGPVSPAEPAYSHNFNISKILINDVEMSGDNIQCQLGKSNIKLKVQYSLIAENPLTGNKNHITGKLSVENGGNSTWLVQLVQTYQEKNVLKLV